jgi:hypothetical protein
MGFLYPYFFKAITIHKTHKNQRIEIPPGSFLEDIYKDKARHLYIMKSTQTGISEYLVIRTFVRAENGKSILYVLPTYEIKNQFVKERIDRTTSYSLYYRSIMGAAENKFAESMSLKQYGSGTIAFVGSNTANAFISFPADDIIIDEYDNCNQENIEMAEERQSASKDKTTVYVANPSITGRGIDLRIDESDDKHWHLKHDACGHWFIPDYFEDVVREIDDQLYVIKDKDYTENSKRDIYPLCPNPKCGKKYDRYSSGRWVNKKKSDISGYRVSKMFSTYTTVKELVNRHARGMTDDVVMQRFHNGDLGLPYQAKGAKIYDYMLDDCCSDYIMPDYLKTNRCIMGVDVGKVLNVIIGEIQDTGIIKIVYIGTVFELEDLTELRKRYRVVAGVIDGLPETRLSKKFCRSFKGGFRWFRHGEKTDKINVEEKIISAFRTGMLDAVKENILTHSIILPQNAKAIPDFYKQMTAATRLYNEKKDIYEWDEGSKADHYMFSMAFMILAKRFISMTGG